MPAYFGHWVGATTRDTFEKKITTLKELGAEFKETIVFRLGEMLAGKTGLGKGIFDPQKISALYIELAERELLKSPKALSEAMNDLDLMRYTLEDYQIVLTNSIPAKRIIKLLPQANEFGRVQRMSKKHGTKNQHFKIAIASEKAD